MYGGFDVFRVYMAVKLHFTTNYNYFDYDGKVNIKLDTFTKRNDRYFFHKLSTKYNQNEILDFFVANFIEKDKLDDRYRYLLIQRKDTLGFIEFLRGKYKELDHKYIQQLLEMMTVCEIDKLKKHTFDEL